MEDIQFGEKLEKWPSQLPSHTGGALVWKVVVIYSVHLQRKYRIQCKDKFQWNRDKVFLARLLTIKQRKKPRQKIP